MSSIQDRGQTDRVTALSYHMRGILTLTYDLDFQPQASYGDDLHKHKL